MKKAFTMIELVFVLLIIGILSAVVLSHTKTNPLQEAAIQLATHLRYTQHLSMVDDTYDAQDENWYRKRWQLVFYKGAYADNEVSYTIFADTSGNSTGDPNKSEIALNPLNKDQMMSGGFSGSNTLDIRKTAFKGMRELNLGKKYGVTDFKLSGGCESYKIPFDYLGRPLNNIKNSNSPYEKGVIKEDCIITLSLDTQSIKLVIKPETGFITIKF